MRRSFIFFFLIFLAGCIDLQRETPEKHFFTLETSRPGATAAAPLFSDLRLDVHVAPAYAGKSFVYRTGDLRVEEDYYNRFFSAPAQLVTGATAGWLRAAGLFAAVYDRPAPGEPVLHLTGSVDSLYGDYRRRPPTAVLEIAFQLTDDRDGGDGTSLHRTYRREIPLEGRTAAALAAGWSQALAEILGELERDLRALAASRAAVPRYTAGKN